MSLVGRLQTRNGVFNGSVRPHSNAKPRRFPDAVCHTIRTTLLNGITQPRKEVVQFFDAAFRLTYTRRTSP
ncbi:hypothetical protein, partial [Rhodopirellula sp. UBA1907]